MISGWRNAITDAPDELTTTLNLIGAVPPLPFLPEAVHGSRVAVVMPATPAIWTSGKQQLPLSVASATRSRMF